MNVLEGLLEFNTTYNETILKGHLDVFLSENETDLYRQFSNELKLGGKNESKNLELLRKANPNTHYRLVEKLKRITLQYIPANAQKNVLQSIHYRMCVNYCCFKFLFGKTYKQPAIILAEQTVRICLKYEYTDFLLELCNELVREYSLYRNDKKKSDYYLAIAHKTLETKQIELKVTQYQCDLAYMFGKTKLLDDRFIKASKLYHEELSGYRGQVPSRYFNKYSFLISLYYFNAIKDHKGVVNLCDEAIEYYQNLPGLDVFAINMFKNYKSASLKQLGKYDQASATIKSVISSTYEGKIQWVNAHMYLMLIELRVQNYDEAIVIYDKVSMKNIVCDPLNLIIFDKPLINGFSRFNTIYENSLRIIFIEIVCIFRFTGYKFMG